MVDLSISGSDKRLEAVKRRWFWNYLMTAGDHACQLDLVNPTCKLQKHQWEKHEDCWYKFPLKIRSPARGKAIIIHEKTANLIKHLQVYTMHAHTTTNVMGRGLLM